jgi:hypothetical protein
VPLRRSVPLQRGLPPKENSRFARSAQPRRGPDRCPEYLAWIRTLGMRSLRQVTGGATIIEAAHTNALGPRGLGQKTSDFSAIPLCAAHHRENLDSYHHLDETVFSHKHGIYLKELVLLLQSWFWQRDVSASRAVHPG